MNEFYTYDATTGRSEHDRFFEQAAPPFKKSREEVWDDLQARMEERPPARVVRLMVNRWLYAAAAIVLLLAGTALVMRFYSTSVTTLPGTHLARLLPDGSSVQLNAGSRLTYYPLWWKVERLARLEGEGFFQVEKGSRFTVSSDMGTTEVLGTSFNIFARQDEYMVTCFSGAVRVISGTSQEVVLNPDDHASIDMQGNITVTRESQPEKLRSWIDGMFSFTSRPLTLVLQEIERQYGVTITLQGGDDYLYTGYFSKDKPVGEVLVLVCKPFGLTFTERSDGSFEIH